MMTKKTDEIQAVSLSFLQPQQQQQRQPHQQPHQQPQQQLQSVQLVVSSSYPHIIDITKYGNAVHNVTHTTVTGRTWVYTQARVFNVGGDKG